MAYSVETNRLTKSARLIYVATKHRRNIGNVGEVRRRILYVNVTRIGVPGLWDYHVTKGWRVSRDKVA